MKPLSPGRSRVLKAIVALSARREAVTIRSIGRECGLTSTNTVKKHIDGLIRDRLLARDLQPRFAYSVTEEGHSAASRQ
jgi:predicted transcriptional regulator